MKTRIVVSASRRTDIPAFYMDWFMAGVEKGVFEVKNPFNQAVYTVFAAAEDVHTIALWSKDFTRFLDGGYGEKLQQWGFHLFFNFTLNSESRLLEPRIPSLDARLEQAGQLCRQFGAKSVQWRFDPICFYRTPEHGSGHNLGDFETIARRLSVLGVKRCVTSFMDFYPKLRRRPKPVAGFEWIDPPLEKKVRVLGRMQQVLEKLGIRLYACCEQQVLEAMAVDAKILPGACIDSRLLVSLFGGRLSFQKDTGQRRGKGCGCTTSRDIGGYADQPCFHNCLYCYANPFPGK
jgi:hypothetical protein